MTNGEPIAPSLADEDVTSIERATLEAVVPDRMEHMSGWLLPMFDGTVGRARSAVPLQHGRPEVALIEPIAARYQERGFVPAFRLPDLPSFDEFHAQLHRRGFERRQPTLTMIGRVDKLLGLHPDPAGELEPKADTQWMDMFLGPGLDPVDGASRVRALSRAPNTLFASVRDAGRTVASGAAAFGQGWLSVHGMRTHADRRGQGLAGRVLATMAQEAQRRGLSRVFLQVDASNVAALALYRRAGLATAWPYSYWYPAD